MSAAKKAPPGAKSPYDQFMEAFLAAHPTLKKQAQFKEGQEAWKKVKEDLKEDPQALKKKLGELKVKAVKFKSQSMLAWAKYENVPPPKRTKEPEGSTTSDGDVVLVENKSNDKQPPSTGEPSTLTVEEHKEKRETPAQDKIRAEISNIEAQLTVYKKVENSGLSTSNHKDISQLRNGLKEKKKKLKRLANDAKLQKKRRDKLRDTIQDVSASNPEIAKKFKGFNRSSSGRPRIEVDQPGLLSAILNIVQASTAADPRRRTEALRSITTLDDMKSELEKLGYNLSRSATYLRLLPRRGNTIEGKRHVQTVPVKLLRPENDLRKKNPDRMFAKSTVDDAQSLDLLFGPHAITFLSNDDKARIPIGLAAANKQAPILMHLEYKVMLPDHSFVVGPQHKLIPSVYCVCEILKDGSLSYSGDTFIRIRSGKHDSSSALTHGYDLEELFETGAIKTKPILVMETDGATDEAPRYPKPLKCAIRLFKKLQLDALVHCVNAAGLSAFNPAERRMAPLSHDLTGIILPHDHFGNHLDSNLKTVDIELEKKNFHHAAKVLSEVWNKTIINNHPVDSKAVEPGHAIDDTEEEDPLWISRHVQQSRYALQVVKCGIASCCKPFSTEWPNVFPSRFIPAPAVYEFGTQGLKAVEPSDYIENPKQYKFANLQDRLIMQKKPASALSKFLRLPFDLYCPSMQEKLDDSVCRKCWTSWPCKAARIRHAKCHKLPALVETQESSDELEDEIEQLSSTLECDDSTTPQECDGRMPVISFETHAKSPFDFLAREPEDTII